MRIMTWNINSVRLRLPLLEQINKAYNPDIICLQELKADAAHFPLQQLEEFGFPYIASHCQKAYNGVAILSKIPFTNENTLFFCGQKDARHIKIDLHVYEKTITLHNFYVPAGGDVPDPKSNPKFKHKLDFVDEMHDYFSSDRSGSEIILVGDLNIAPLANDVWSHKQLLHVVSHTEAEVSRLNKLYNAFSFVDIARVWFSPEKKLYTWWSYRARDWLASNRGRRLDHIWVSQKLADKVKNFHIATEVRGWNKPSDHVPVIMDL